LLLDSHKTHKYTLWE